MLTTQIECYDLMVGEPSEYPGFRRKNRKPGLIPSEIPFQLRVNPDQKSVLRSMHKWSGLTPLQASV